MNRFRLLAVATVLAFAVPAIAQQESTTASATHIANAPVEQHLKMLSDKLDLTADQQDKARPILQQMHNDTQKIVEDKSLTQDEAAARMHPIFMKADKELREFLTDDQKKKLDVMEQQMHPEHHGGESGAPPSTPQL